MGKKVGTAIGGAGHEYLGVVLKKAGIPAEKVAVLNVPPGNSVSALAGGQVDAIAGWEPYGTLMLEKVPDAVLVQRGGGFIGYFIDMSTLVDVMEKQPDMVYRYVVALAEASPVHAAAPGRGGRDLHPLDSRAGGRRGPKGDPAHLLRSPDHQVLAGELGRERAGAGGAEEAATVSCRGLRGSN